LRLTHGQVRRLTRTNILFSRESSQTAAHKDRGVFALFLAVPVSVTVIL
jgi:hypothetical protein